MEQIKRHCQAVKRHNQRVEVYTFSASSVVLKLSGYACRACYYQQASLLYALQGIVDGDEGLYLSKQIERRMFDSNLTRVVILSNDSETVLATLLLRHDQASDILRFWPEFVEFLKIHARCGS